MDIISHEILMNGILPFIGNFHFRYIAGINRQFYRSYTTLYPSKETYVFNGNMSSLLDASMDYIPAEIQLCLDEIDKDTISNVLRDDQIITLHKIAATNGNVELLKYLQDTYQYLFGFQKMLNRKRSRSNQKKDTTWLQGRRSFCATAALHGRLDMIQLSRCQYDFPWDEETCSNAALHGHWHILKFAYKHQCPWNSKTRTNAEAYCGKNSEEITKWLQQRGCRVPRQRYNFDNDDRHEEYYNYMYLSEHGYY
jgi:hypothetical protein